MIGNITALSLRHEPAWHGIGEVFPEDEEVSVWQGFQRTGLDFQFRKEQLVSIVDNTTIESDSYAVLRPRTIVSDSGSSSTDYSHVATVGKNYELVQTSLIAEVLEPLAKRWPLDTVGALDDGGLIWVCLNMGERDVNGDVMTNYLFANNYNNGKGSLHFGQGIVRQVCQNTILASEQSAISINRIRHSAGANIEFSVFGKVMQNQIKRQEEVYRQLRDMGRTLLDKETQENIIEKIYALPTMPAKVDKLQQYVDEHSLRGLEDDIDVMNWVSDAEKAKAAYTLRRAAVTEQRNDVYALREKFNDEFPQYANTAWMILNTVVEHADWSKGRRVDRSSLFGTRAALKKAAYKEIVRTLN